MARLKESNSLGWLEGVLWFNKIRERRQVKGESVEVEQPDWLQQIEGILESLNEGVLISDDCQNVIFTNSNFQEMTGIPRSELFGMDSYKFYTQEEAEFIERQKERSRIQGRNRFEFVLPRSDGGRLPVIISAKVIEDPDGRQYTIVSFTDISELKNAENELRDANKKLEERHEETQDRVVRGGQVCP